MVPFFCSTSRIGAGGTDGSCPGAGAAAADGATVDVGVAVLLDIDCCCCSVPSASPLCRCSPPPLSGGTTFFFRRLYWRVTLGFGATAGASGVTAASPPVPTAGGDRCGGIGSPTAASSLGCSACVVSVCFRVRFSLTVLVPRTTLLLLLLLLLAAARFVRPDRPPTRSSSGCFAAVPSVPSAPCCSSAGLLCFILFRVTRAPAGTTFFRFSFSTSTRSGAAAAAAAGSNSTGGTVSEEQAATDVVVVEAAASATGPPRSRPPGCGWLLLSCTSEGGAAAVELFWDSSRSLPQSLEPRLWMIWQSSPGASVCFGVLLSDDALPSIELWESKSSPPDREERLYLLLLLLLPLPVGPAAPLLLPGVVEPGAAVPPAPLVVLLISGLPPSDIFIFSSDLAGAGATTAASPEPPAAPPAAPSSPHGAGGVVVLCGNGSTG
uniref:Uncharacterized protein n=1 Tax=Anopheles merus TaxID=30066 RepID=A0A182UUD0_ANOME